MTKITKATKILKKSFEGFFMGTGLEVAKRRAKGKDNVIIIVSAYNGCVWFFKSENKIRKLSRKEAVKALTIIKN